MKTILSLACIVSFIFCGPNAQPQGAPAEPDNYIVVIGAFSIEENANHFLSSALEKKLKAKARRGKVERGEHLSHRDLLHPMQLNNYRLNIRHKLGQIKNKNFTNV